MPIYIGDDTSDEDAFKVILPFAILEHHFFCHVLIEPGFFDCQFLRERKCGIGICVSSIPKETKASYSLKDPPEVNKNAKESFFLAVFTRPRLCNSGRSKIVLEFVILGDGVP